MSKPDKSTLKNMTIFLKNIIMLFGKDSHVFLNTPEVYPFAKRFMNQANDSFQEIIVSPEDALFISF